MENPIIKNNQKVEFIQIVYDLYNNSKLSNKANIEANEKTIGANEKTLTNLEKNLKVFDLYIDEIEFSDNEETRHKKTPPEPYIVLANYTVTVKAEVEAKTRTDFYEKLDEVLNYFINTDYNKLLIADLLLNRGSVIHNIFIEIISSDIYNNNKTILELRKQSGEEKEGDTQKEKKFIKIAIHTVSQLFGDNKEHSLFSDEKIDAFSRATGLSIHNRPDSYGVVLNQSQRRVLDGILKAFSDSNYSGDEEIDKTIYKDKFHPIDKITKAYSNIDKIPVIRLTQAQVIELSGYDLKSQRQGDKVDVVDALSFLATKQFCFYWLRSKMEKGKYIKDKRGSYIKEEVMEVGTLFRIKEVMEEGKLQYYEIHPSAPVLDQVNSYFLLVPNDWREEVKQITGKRASGYTYELLLWLRLQYEQIRRYNKAGGKKRPNKPFHLSRSWEEVAVALKMPESMYKANRKRASKIIQEAYSVAIKLGYLLKVDDNGATDILYLNESYYPKPGELV